MASRKQLPKGFRYLFTTREAKAMATVAGVRFTAISTGNVTAAGRLQTDSIFQSSFRGPSLDAYYTEDGWQFRFHQSGFREELLPPEFEGSVRTEVHARFVGFMRRVLSAQATDFLRSPGIWAYIMLTNGKANVSYTEHK